MILWNPFPPFWKWILNTTIAPRGRRSQVQRLSEQGDRWTCVVPRPHTITSFYRGKFDHSNIHLNGNLVNKIQNYVIVMISSNYTHPLMAPLSEPRTLALLSDAYDEHMHVVRVADQETFDLCELSSALNKFLITTLEMLRCSSSLSQFLMIFNNDSQGF